MTISGIHTEQQKLTVSIMSDSMKIRWNQSPQLGNTFVNILFSKGRQSETGMREMGSGGMLTTLFKVLEWPIKKYQLLTLWKNHSNQNIDCAFKQCVSTQIWKLSYSELL